MQVLSNELLYYLLDFFTGADVNRAALISRRTRAIATTHSNFCIPCLAALDEVNTSVALDRMDHALALGLPMSLRITFYEEKPSSAQTNTHAEICRGLSRVTHLVVKLVAHVPSRLIDILHSVLLHPYPLLRYIALSQPLPGPTVTLSPELFCGFAPQLRRVHMHQVVPPAMPVAAFSDVRDVSMNLGRHTNTLDMAAHFPSAKIIRISTDSSEIAHNNIHPGLTTHGCVPEHLRVSFVNVGASTLLSDQLQRRLNIDRIATVSWSIDNLQAELPILPEYWVGLAAGTVALHVGEEEPDGYVVLAARSVDTQRQIHVGNWVTKVVPRVIQLFSARIVDLRLDTGALFHADWFPIFMYGYPALERLHLEFSETGPKMLPDCDPICDIIPLHPSNNALRTVLLTAGLGIGHEEEDSISTAAVEHIGLLLGLSQRKRVALQVFGLDLIGDDNALKGMFLDVATDSLDRAWRASPLDLSGLWILPSS